jgi:glycosyltransferase involved in cell wall biosynthesis
MHLIIDSKNLKGDYDMRIMIFVKGYSPAKNFGGPPISVENIVNLLSDKFQFFIVTSNYDRETGSAIKEIPLGWVDHNNARVIYLSKDKEKYHVFRKLIEEVEPNLLYVNTFFDYLTILPLLELGKRLCVPVLIGVRGQLCKNALKMGLIKKKIYILIFRFYFRKCKFIFHATSEEEISQLESELKVDPRMILSADNIPTLSKEAIVSRIKMAGQIKIVYISRIHRKKNIIFSLELIKKLKGRVVFDLYGNINDLDYMNEINNFISTLPSNIVAKYKGVVDHDSVHETFMKYDVFLFPTLTENYGHAIAESILSFTPVITSDQTPWADMIKYNVGWAISLNNQQEYIDVLQMIIDMDDFQYHAHFSQFKEYIEERFNLEELRSKYIDMFEIISKSSRLLKSPDNEKIAPSN